MKKKILLVLAAILLLLIGAYTAQRLAASHLYPATMLVLETDRSSDTVLMATESGHAYAFYGVEDYEVDDILSVTMFDNFTPIVFDDQVVTVRYSGF